MDKRCVTNMLAGILVSTQVAKERAQSDVELVRIGGFMDAIEHVAARLDIKGSTLRNRAKRVRALREAGESDKNARVE